MSVARQLSVQSRSGVGAIPRLCAEWCFGLWQRTRNAVFIEQFINCPEDIELWFSAGTRPPEQGCPQGLALLGREGG